MNKTIAFPTAKEARPLITFDLPYKQFEPIINQALNRLGSLTVSGKVTNIDLSNNELEIELDKQSTHPEITSIIKIIIEIVKLKNSTKYNKDTNKKTDKFIQNLLLNLVIKCGKDNVLHHIETLVEQAKGKNMTQRDYLKLIFLIKPRQVKYILKYLSLSLKLKKFQEGAHFCSIELKKDYNTNLKSIIKLYHVYFKLNLPDNGHSEKNKQHLMQIFDLIKHNRLHFLTNTIESSPVPFLVNQLTDLMIANLNTFILNNEELTAYEIINTLSKKIPELTNNPTLISKILILLIPFTVLLTNENTHQEIITTFITNKAYLNNNFWLNLNNNKLNISDNLINNFIETITNNYEFSDPTSNLALIALAKISTNENQCDKLLKQILTHPIESNALDLLHIFTKFPSTKIETQFEPITYRSTPYGHIIWLINMANRTTNNKTLTQQLDIIKYALDHICLGSPFNENDIYPLCQPIIGDDVYKTEFNQLPFKIIKHYLGISTKDQLEWLKRKPKFDEESHFTHLLTPCKTNQEHQLHIQNHSNPHINGHTCELRNSKSKTKKTKFLESILSKDNLTLIKDAWSTFDPHKFDTKLSIGTVFSRASYWRVKFDYPLSEENDTILTLQVSIIDEGVYSIHIHPSNNGESKIDGIFTINNKSIKKQRRS